MPRKREGEEQIRVHIWIFKSDWEELRALYSESFGPSKFVRLAVRQVLKKVREKMNVGTAKSPSIAIELGDEPSPREPATGGPS